MTLALLSDAAARVLLDRVVGSELGPFDVAAELLRQETSARRSCPRHLLINRVCRLAAPVVSLDEELVSDVFDKLEREGDLLLAEGGLVYPTPVRIVALGEGVLRFVCAIPSARLFPNVDGEWSRRGVRRDCRTRQPIEEVADALGGVVLAPEAWAGLDRVPAADEAWLTMLDARLAWDPEQAASLEQDEPLEWAAFVTDKGEPRWRASGPSKLWRARHRWKRWVYAWSAGDSPRSTAFVALQPDEGVRTTFALARTAGTPFQGTLTKKEHGNAVLALAAWLPLAEYRYLSTCAEPVEATARGSSWSLPEARAKSVVATVADRLGLRIEQVQAHE
jgi:hypothetical protein